MPALSPNRKFPEMLAFIPATTRWQCRSLVVSYHARNGYACIPDILWKSGLGKVIEDNHCLQNAFQIGVRARTAQKANHYLTALATELLSIEVIAREYSRNELDVRMLKDKAISILERSSDMSRIWLLDYYFYFAHYSRLSRLPVEIGERKAGQLLQLVDESSEIES